MNAMFEKISVQASEALQLLIGNVNSTLTSAVYQWDIDTRLLDPSSKEINPLFTKISALEKYCYEMCEMSWAVDF